MEDDKYDLEVLGKISDEKNWPRLDNIETIKKLLSIADKQYESKTIEGFLSSILIYQQVIEEYLINLLKLSNLYIQAEIWPVKITLKIQEKLMFGKLIELHKRTIDFDEKTNLLNECKQFNGKRNKFVHCLLKFKTEKEMFRDASQIKKSFELITDFYFNGYGFLEWKLADLKKRVDWNEFL